MASLNGHGNHAGNLVTVQGAGLFHKFGQRGPAYLGQQQTFRRIMHLPAPAINGTRAGQNIYASGKILRKDLRAPYWEGYERMVN